ncbi:WxL domain-containing protein [Levilactobacillus humaensis]|uniref:WxL domain-containing protein n=1 Tax=Levilactobacillus humaensis TaxID=2950375 RepID=UPI0021C46913|nr:WxL domain-containing protein [Levilactobacillus humaensis]
MKKTVSSILLASALLLGSIAPVVANADAASSTGTTKGSVTFTKPEPVTTPVDPANPGTPSTTPGDNGGTTPSGDLTFLYVTKTLDFGTHETSTSNKQSFTAATNSDGKSGSISTTTFAGTTANPNFVTEVSDTRATNAGWKVQLSADNFTDGTNNLTGAVLNFNAKSGLAVTNSVSADGITQENAAPVLGSGSAVDVYNAAKGSGAGSTAFQLDPSNISLSNIPANVTVTGDSTTYSGNLNWTLASTPEA